MLYLVKFDIDQQALGFGPEREKVSSAEGERAKAVKKEGRLKGLWRRADCGGAVFVLDAPSHEALVEELSSLPLFPYLRNIDVTPLVPHPVYPECSAVTPQ